MTTANDPLANLIAVNVQNNYIPSLSETDGQANVSNLRVVTPVWRFIPRVTLPVQSLMTPTKSVSGFGDLNVFGTFVLTPDDAKVAIAAGPMYTAPTATNDLLGTGKHQLGVSAAAIRTAGPLMIGTLVLWQASVAGASDRSNTNNMAIQTFLFVQAGNGVYLRSAPIATLDFKQKKYAVPLGIGIGKVVAVGNTVFNFFIEPQYSVYHHGAGVPIFQLFSAINLQFKTK
ncbi:MAG: hypothetical protein R3A47_03655 [Polyangiales bacterium]